MVLMSWLIFSPSCHAYKIPISWHKTSKTQHFMNYWCFWSWNRVFLHFIGGPEDFKKIKKNKGASLEKMGKHFSKNSETQYFRFFGNLSLPFFEFLEFLKFRIPEFLIIKNDEFLKIMKSRRRGISWDSFCRRNFSKSLHMNSIKKHETLFPKSEPTFLFWGEVISITNQRTDGQMTSNGHSSAKS